MSKETQGTNDNPLASAPIEKLLPRFAIPAILSILMSALYNIVDQIFIGQGVGMLGNAATNVAFPISIICIGLSLLFGMGGAANFSLEMGRKDKERAADIVGTAFTALATFGIILCAVVLIFLRPLMLAFGATDTILEYSITYASITGFGIPFMILTTGGSHLIRADRSPMFSMVAVVSGAVLNTILDPIFIFVFKWGIAGAAIATLISQIFSAVFIVYYITRFKTISLTLNSFVPKWFAVKAIVALGIAACMNQFAMTAVQIAMNNLLRHYGGLSVYGSEIPLAVSGLVAKVNMVFLSLIIGLSLGAQPILGFNYGANNYARVRRTFKLVLSVGMVLSVTAFISFQFFPRPIISIFGKGDELYYIFAVKYFRIFLFFTFINSLQPITSNFFTAIGKAQKGLLMSITRQLVFLLPLIFLLPMLIGIDGIMYAGPIADFAAFSLAVGFLLNEFRKMPKDNLCDTQEKNTFEIKGERR